MALARAAACRARGEGGRGRGNRGRGRGSSSSSCVERRPRDGDGPRQLTEAQREKLEARARDERDHFLRELEAARTGVGGSRSHGRCLVDDEERLFGEMGETRGSNALAYEDVGARIVGVERDPIDADARELERSVGTPSEVVDNLRRAGISTLTLVQRYAVPVAADGLDVLCNSPTGSGKTAAYMLPLIGRLVRECEDGGSREEKYDVDGTPVKPRVIVLAPTRELALQIHMETRKFIFGTPLWCACAYGGNSIKPQLEELSFLPEILIATPGRLLSMVRDKLYVDLSRVETLVMDEADRMLDMGFEPQLNELLGDHGMPGKNERQTLMFSATFPQQVLRLASYYMRAPPDAARVICGRVGSTVAGIQQVLIETPHLREQKFPYLMKILEAVEKKREHDGEEVGLTLIFCKQKQTAEWLRERLVEETENKLAVEELHGSLTQGARLRALDAFASGAAKILVATDVAARGLDLPQVNHVINFDLPTKKSEFDDYIHRIGRTGRAGRKGIASSLYVPGFARDIGNGPIYEDLKLVLEETNTTLPAWFAQSADARGSLEASSASYKRGYRGGRTRRF